MRFKLDKKITVSLLMTIAALSLPCIGLGLDVSAFPVGVNRPYETRTQLSKDVSSYSRASLLGMMPGEIDNFENAVQYYCDINSGTAATITFHFIDRIRSELSYAMDSESIDGSSPTDTAHLEDIMYANSSNHTEHGSQWCMDMPVYNFVQEHEDVYSSRYFVNLINTIRSLVDRIHSQVN